MNTCRTIVILLFLPALSVLAQDSLKAITLEDVVVTGQYELQSISKSVYQLRIISAEQLQEKGVTNLQDVLNTELNFRFSQDLALGTSTITMNGLPGQYVKVLLDGVPIVGRASNNDINLNQININTIERIEIVDGPMSVAYGADALAGVINIITKKGYLNKLSVSARMHEESIGNEYGTERGIHNQYVSFGYSGKNVYTKAEGGRNYAGGWRGNATGREKQWHPKTQWVGAGVLGYKTEKVNVYYRLDVLNDLIYNPGEFQGQQALDQHYVTNRLMHQMQGELELTHKLSYNGSISYTQYERKTQSVNVDATTGRETLSLGDGQQDVTSFNGLTARGTFQYKLSQKISIQPGYDINSESGQGGRLKAGTHTINDYAFFLSAEYTPVKFVSIRPGIRMIKNSQYGTPLITSLNTKFNLSEKADLRISYGRGFRSPSLRELYFNFFDANHSIEGNPDLEPEYSHSFNTSVTWQNIKVENVTIQNILTGFYNTVDNMIASGYRPGNTTVTSYINIAQFKTTGTTLSTRWHYKHIDVNAGVGYTGRYNDFEQEDDTLPNFLWSPEVTASASYIFAKISLTANLYYKYTGKLFYYETVVVEDEQKIRQAWIDSFNWIDLSLKKQMFQYATITAGVRNLFNIGSIQNTTANVSGSHGSGADQPLSPGRSFFISLNFQLTK